jgi:hypothetical protein
VVLTSLSIIDVQHNLILKIAATATILNLLSVDFIKKQLHQSIQFFFWGGDVRAWFLQKHINFGCDPPLWAERSCARSAMPIFKVFEIILVHY